MQKILFILVILTFVAESCDVISNSEIYINESNKVLVLENSSAYFFSQNGSFYMIFDFKKNNNAYCMNSVDIGCYVNESKNYTTCIKIHKKSLRELSIESKDSCTNKNLMFNKLNFSSMEKQKDWNKWDSLKIYIQSYESTKIKTLLYKYHSQLKADNHPLSIAQEVFIFQNTNYGPFEAPSAKEIRYKFVLYNKNKIVKTQEGDLVPNIFSSMMAVKI